MEDRAYKAQDAQQDNFMEQVKQGYKTDTYLAKNQHDFDCAEGLLWHGRALYVPEAGKLRRKCIQTVHDHPFSGHVGIARTAELLSRLYWWPSCKRDVTQNVQQCEQCQRNKSRNVKPPGKLLPLPIPGNLWESVSIDFITHLPKTPRGHTAIMVVVDRLSKMTHFIPTKDEVNGEQTARLFLDNVFRLHGCPQNIISDRGSIFTSKFWAALCQLAGIKRNMSSAYHPQSDGQTERMNRVLKDMIRHYVNPVTDDWDDHLTPAEFAVNNAWQESIQSTPFRLNYGRDPVAPAGLQLAGAKNPRAIELTSGLAERLVSAKSCMHAAQQRQKAYADQGRSECTFQVDDDVLLSTKNVRLKGPGAKSLMPRWIGPYRIVKQVNDVAYELELPKNLRLHDVFHASQLKLYHPREGGYRPPPPELTTDGSLEYEVDGILSHRVRSCGRGRRTRLEYLVHWRGYDPANDTWEPEDNLVNCPGMLMKYHQMSEMTS